MTEGVVPAGNVTKTSWSRATLEKKLLEEIVRGFKDAEDIKHVPLPSETANEIILYYKDKTHHDNDRFLKALNAKAADIRRSNMMLKHLREKGCLRIAKSVVKYLNGTLEDANRQSKNEIDRMRHIRMLAQDCVRRLQCPLNHRKYTSKSVENFYKNIVLPVSQYFSDILKKKKQQQRQARNGQSNEKNVSSSTAVSSSTSAAEPPAKPLEENPPKRRRIGYLSLSTKTDESRKVTGLFSWETNESLTEKRDEAMCDDAVPDEIAAPWFVRVLQKRALAKEKASHQA